MKKLYEFTIPQKVTKEIPIETINEKDEKVQTFQKKEELVERKYFIKKPSRVLFDEADLFMAVKTGEFIKKGCLTRSMITKRLSDDGGTLSDNDKRSYEDLYKSYYHKEADFQKLNLIAKDERTKQQQEDFDRLLLEKTTILQEIQEFELMQSSIFEHCAENKARDKTALWWVLQLSYEDAGDGPKPLFGDGEYEQRQEKYHDIEDGDDEFLQHVVQKFIYLISLWYLGRASTKEDFELFLKKEKEYEDNQKKALEKMEEEFEKEQTKKQKRPRKKKKNAQNPEGKS